MAVALPTGDMLAWLKNALQDHPGAAKVRIGLDSMTMTSPPGRRQQFVFLSALGGRVAAPAYDGGFFYPVPTWREGWEACRRAWVASREDIMAA